MNNNSQFTALVTGATSGIGYELAKILAEEGYNLIIVSRSKEELAAVAQNFSQQYGVKATPIDKDLFEPGAGEELYNEVKASGLQVDILVNNAAQGQFGEFADADLQRLLDIIQLNISSLVTLTHVYLKDMLSRGSGRILNLSSIAGKVPGPWQAVYHGTKAFVQSFTEAIRSEVKDKGITVTALLPGVTDTDFFNKADMNDSKAVQDKNKMADPADVAKDGYEALMRGDDMVVSGWKNKLQVAMGALTPDEQLADQMKKQQEPVSKK